VGQITISLKSVGVIGGVCPCCIEHVVFLCSSSFDNSF